MHSHYSGATHASVLNALTAWWNVSRPGYSTPAPDRKSTQINFSIPPIRVHLYPGTLGWEGEEGVARGGGGGKGSGGGEGTGNFDKIV